MTVTDAKAEAFNWDGLKRKENGSVIVGQVLKNHFNWRDILKMILQFIEVAVFVPFAFLTPEESLKIDKWRHLSAA